MNNSDQAMNSLDGIILVPEPSEKRLNERQYLDYRSTQEQCLEWLLTFGKDPEKAAGYARPTVKTRAFAWIGSTVGSGIAKVGTRLMHSSLDRFDTGDLKPCATGLALGGGDIPAVGLTDLLDDCQSEPCAVIARGMAAVEYIFAVRFGDARTVIGHVESTLIIQDSDGDSHRLTPVLDGVAKQVF